MNDAGHTHEHMLKHDPGRIRDEDATLAANSHPFLPVRADSRQTLPPRFEFTRGRRWWMDGTSTQALWRCTNAQKSAIGIGRPNR